MCNVPSIAVFCSESIECFPGTFSKISLKFLATIPVAAIDCYYYSFQNILYSFISLIHLIYQPIHAM